MITVPPYKLPLLLSALIAASMTRCASAPAAYSKERLALQDDEVVAAGIAFLIRTAPRARRYEVQGPVVHPRTLAFAANLSRHVAVPAGLEAPDTREVEDVTVRILVKRLIWWRPAQATLSASYRAADTDPVECDLSLVHSDNGPSWGLERSQQPGCAPK